MIERRRNGRRYEDRPKPMYMSRTVLCAWVGILAAVTGMLGFPLSCEEQTQMANSLISIIMLLSSFGAFLFRIAAKRPIG